MYLLLSADIISFLTLDCDWLMEGTEWNICPSSSDVPTLLVLRS